MQAYNYTNSKSEKVQNNVKPMGSSKKPSLKCSTRPGRQTSQPSPNDWKENSKIRAMIERYESRDEAAAGFGKDATAVDIIHTSSQRQEVEKFVSGDSLESRSVDMRTTVPLVTSDVHQKQKEISNDGKATDYDILTEQYEQSPLWKTIDALTGGKSMSEQVSLLRGLVLDLMQEVDTSRLELQQVHRELVQRDQLIQDLREERKMIREEHQCKLLSMAQALSELDQQKAIMDTMKHLESDAVVPASSINNMVIQQLTRKVEDLELQNADLAQKLAGREDGKQQIVNRWRR